MAGWIRHHHERWDGAGYPDRLAGDAIPRASQIIAIAAGFNDALAREGGSAASWRWTQSGAGEFDPCRLTTSRLRSVGCRTPPRPTAQRIHPTCG